MADSQRKTANLFDVSQLSLRNGYAINDNGVEIESQYTGYTLNHISCKQETQYVLSYLVSSDNNGYYRVYFYDEDDNFISRTSSYVPTAMPFEMHITTPSNATSFAIQYAYGGVTNNWNDLMINTGSTALPYEPYGWLHSLRKLTTATEAVENPLYSDGTAITSYTIKGNTVQNGTPTPSNPVEVNGVGERTENLFDYQTMLSGVAGHYLSAEGSEIINDYWAITKYIPVDGTVFTLARTFGGGSPSVCLYDVDKHYITGVSYNSNQITTISDSRAKYARFSYFVGYEGQPAENVANDMLVEGSTAPSSYIPYGYKIPISSGVTTNIYLGSTQTTRQIKKIVFDGSENWQGDDNTVTKYLPDFYGYKIESGVTCMSTHYSGANNVLAGDPIPNNSACFFIGGYPQALYVKGSEPITLADFKAYLAQQYANGTPVTVWYVLATAETAAVNQPLMKIGDYVDTLSNAASIPTTEGANSISVDTTVQPSEFTATWTGWHDATVKEAKHGNNLFDYTTMSVSDENSYLNSDGTIGVSNDWNITEYIPCDGTSFTIGDIGGNTPAICLYNANKEYITGKSYNTGGTYQKQAINITSQSTAKYIRFSYCKGSLNPDDISAIMLNSGSTLMPYEPYGIHWE